jgi:replicative DNA helicase
MTRSKVSFPDNQQPEVKAHQVVLRVVEAQETDTGLQATVHAINGRLLVGRHVDLEDAADRKAFAREVHAAGGAQIAERMIVRGLQGLIRGVRALYDRFVSGRGGSSEEIEWESIIPFDVCERLPAPSAMLSGWGQAWVEQVAEATQTPADLAFNVWLMNVSAAVGGKVSVRIKRGWDEPGHCYFVVALRPGERKTAVFAAGAAPIQRWEREATRTRAPEIARSVAERRSNEKRAAHLEGKAATCATDRREGYLDEAVEYRKKLILDKPVVAPQVLADDATPEKIANLMATQGGRLAVLSDEATIFEHIAGKYQKSPNFSVFLQAHAGTPIRVDRIHRAPDHIPYPALTMGLTVQPAALANLQNVPDSAGRGLLARFLWSIPDSRVGTRRNDVPALAPETQERYADYLTRLLNLPPDVDAETGEEMPYVLTFSADARAALIGFMDWLEPQLGPGGALEPLEGWGGKVAGAVARIAGLLHMADGVARDESGWFVHDEIDVATVERAIALGHYYITHARAAFGVMRADTDEQNALFLLSLFAKAGTDRMTRRDLFHAARPRLQHVTDMDAPLEMLFERGYLQEQPTVKEGGVGRKPSPTYIVHPEIVAQNAQNGDHSGHSGQAPAASESRPPVASAAEEEAAEEEKRRVTARIGLAMPNTEVRRLVTRLCKAPTRAALDELWRRMSETPPYTGLSMECQGAVAESYAALRAYHGAPLPAAARSS